MEPPLPPPVAPDGQGLPGLDGTPHRLPATAHPERTRRFVLFGLLLLNLLMLLICAGLLWSSRQTEIRDAQTQTLSAARLTEQAASGMFNEASIALGAVGAQLERQLARGGMETDILWSVVDAQAAQVPEIQRVGVFDASGVQVCGQPASRCQHLNISDRDYFQRLRDHPDDPVKLYGPHANRLDERAALLLVRSLRAPDGRFAGVVLALLPLEGLRGLVTTPKFGLNGVVSLRTADLELLVRQPELQGPDATEAGKRVSSTLKAAMEAAPAEGVYREVTASDGVERVTAYRRLATQPLYVLVGQATDDFLAGWHRQVAWTSMFLLLLAAASWQLARVSSVSLRRHAQVQRLYDEAPCGYHALDTNGVYLSVNATELAWLGLPHDEVVGRLKPSDFFTDEGRAIFAANFPQLARTGRLQGLDLDLISRDGTTRRVLISAKAARDDKGVFLHSNSVMYDISALHAARSQLRALAQEQSLMLDNDLIGIVKLVNRRVVWKNQAMDRIFGYSGAQWQDMSTRPLYIDDESYQRVGAQSRAALQEGRTYRNQLEMQRSDGSKVWIDLTGSLLSAGTGEVMMMLTDITALKQAETTRIHAASLEAQNFQLQETSRLKSEFVSNMSHELRTPLNAILGFGQLLESGSAVPDSPKHTSYIKQIVGSGHHLLGLIDQVLDYARVESGKMAFTPRPLRLQQAFQELAELLRAECAAKNIALRLQVDAGMEEVVADALRLRQMLLALVGNAIKFSHNGGQVQVQACALDSALWQLRVTDHGIGIAQADQALLFSPFRQLSSGNTKAYGGTGIGLALVKLLAQAQGGRVDVHSQAGQGSVFSLTLPRVLPQSPQVGQG